MKWEYTTELFKHKAGPFRVSFDKHGVPVALYAYVIIKAAYVFRRMPLARGGP